MAKIIIVGKGPAGISAALYAARGNAETIVIGKDGGALLKADKIENYYGFAEPVSGTELQKRSVHNAVRLGVKMVDDEVVGISYDGTFLLETKNGEYQGEAVILATGAARQTPQIEGVAAYEGRGVSYCAVCDAFFYRKKDVAVLGNGEYALHEAAALLPVVSSVTLLTDGAPLLTDVPPEIKVDDRKIERLVGDDTLSGVRFIDGETLPVAGLFVAIGVASSGDLARKVGALTENNRIVINEKKETNIPGLYAAGDCTGGLLQVAKAVADGAVAGTQALSFLRAKKK